MRKELLKEIYIYWNLFLISIRLEKNVKELLKEIHGQWNLSLITIWPKMCERALEEQSNTLEYVPDRYKIWEMYDKNWCSKCSKRYFILFCNICDAWVRWNMLWRIWRGILRMVYMIKPSKNSMDLNQKWVITYSMQSLPMIILIYVRGW